MYLADLLIALHFLESFWVQIDWPAVQTGITPTCQSLVQTNPKNNPVGPKRAQNDPKKAKDKKVNKKKTLQNESF